MNEVMDSAYFANENNNFFLPFLCLESFIFAFLHMEPKLVDHEFIIFYSCSLS